MGVILGRYSIHNLCTKITWTSLAKNELQVHFSHKFSKNKFVFLNSATVKLYPPHLYGLIKHNYPKLICIDRGMIEELRTIFI